MGNPSKRRQVLHECRKESNHKGQDRERAHDGNGRVTLKMLRACIDKVCEELEIEDDAIYRRDLFINAAMVGGFALDQVANSMRMRRVEVLRIFEGSRAHGCGDEQNEPMLVMRVAWARARTIATQSARKGTTLDQEGDDR